MGFDGIRWVTFMIVTHRIGLIECQRSMATIVIIHDQ